MQTTANSKICFALRLNINSLILGFLLYHKCVPESNVCIAPETFSSTVLRSTLIFRPVVVVNQTNLQGCPLPKFLSSKSGNCVAKIVVVVVVVIVVVVVVHVVVVVVEEEVVVVICDITSNGGTF